MKNKVLISLIMFLFILSNDLMAASNVCNESSENGVTIIRGVKDGKKYSYKTHCYNNDIIYKYSCDGDNVKMEESYCNNGCNNGVCNPIINNNSDKCASIYENGRKITIGTKDGKNFSYKDYCNGDKFYEYSCDGNELIKDSGTCTKGCDSNQIKCKGASPFYPNTLTLIVNKENDGVQIKFSTIDNRFLEVTSMFSNLIGLIARHEEGGNCMIPWVSKEQSEFRKRNIREVFLKLIHQRLDMVNNPKNIDFVTFSNDLNIIYDYFSSFLGYELSMYMLEKCPDSNFKREKYMKEFDELRLKVYENIKAKKFSNL